MFLQFNQIHIAARSAWRTFQRNRLYGVINIVGLSIAFATLTLVISYLYEETSYEAFHQKADRIYRPTYHVKGQGDFDIHFARIPVDYINELPAEFPEIEQLIRFQNKEQKYVRVGKKRFKAKDDYVTDPEVFEVFSLPLLEGDPFTALTEPYSVVLSEQVAKTYFGRSAVLGEEIMVSGDWSAQERAYRVTGLLKDLPVNTHLPIEMLFSFPNEEARSGWAYVYTLLRPGAEISQVAAKMPAFIEKHIDPENSPEILFEFQPLSGIHLHSQLAREIRPNGQWLYVKIFFWVGLFVWIIALVNFSNLSMAIALNRGKEMGMRRLMGASRRNLVLFSLIEAILYSSVALVLGLLLAYLLFPYFSRLTGISMIPTRSLLIPVVAMLALVSAMLGGLLPASLFTSVKSRSLLKLGSSWSLKRTGQRIPLKRVLIGFQFAISILLLSGALIAYRQIHFVQNKNLGLRSEQILALTEVPDPVKEQYALFKQKLEGLSGVSGMTACMQVPSTEIRDVGPVLVKGQNEDPDQAPMMDIQVIDPDFIQLMQLNVVAGTDFTDRTPLPSYPEFSENFTVAQYLSETPRRYLLNETAARVLGWNDPQEALGKEINWSIGPFKLAFGPIAGVVKDYHQESLKNKVDPLILIVEPIWLSNFLIKVETDHLDATLAAIEQRWNESFPYPLEYHFLDELFNRLYQQDRIQLQLLSILALVALLISLIGLISLVAFALRTKAKELAIRRVIGANLRTLTFLMAREYFWILLIASFFGIPLAYYWSVTWLENFAYQIALSPWHFLLPVLSIGLTLLLTIFLQARRATGGNPVEALREE